MTKPLIIICIGLVAVLIFNFAFNPSEEEEEKQNNSVSINIPEEELEYIQDDHRDKMSIYDQEENEKNAEEMKRKRASFEDVNSVVYQITPVEADEEKENLKVYGAEIQNPTGVKGNFDNLSDNPNFVSSEANTPISENKVASPPVRKRKSKKTYTPPAKVEAVVEEKRPAPANFNSSSFSSGSSSFGAQSKPQPKSNTKNDKEKPYTTPIIDLVVFGTQNIINGQPIRLRMRQDAIINGVKIPKNTIFSAPTSFSGQRLNVNITNIPAPNGSNVATNLVVYDIDHLRGIRINQNIDGKAAKDEGSGIAGEVIGRAVGSNEVGSAVNNLFNQIARGEKPVEVPQGHELTMRISQ